MHISRRLFITFAFRYITDPFYNSFETDEAMIFILKGKSKLNHLLFMDDLKFYGSNQNKIDSLVRTVEIETKDVGLKFGIDKCGVLAMNREKEVECNGIQ